MARKIANTMRIQRKLVWIAAKSNDFCGLNYEICEMTSQSSKMRTIWRKMFEIGCEISGIITKAVKYQQNQRNHFKIRENTAKFAGKSMKSSWNQWNHHEINENLEITAIFLQIMWFPQNVPKKCRKINQRNELQNPQTSEVMRNDLRNTRNMWNAQQNSQTNGKITAN